MLAADSLTVLGPALAPPPGYAVDTVIAATYSLDLLVALGLPLALVRSGELAGRDADTVPPVALLEAIRRLSKRYRVFCDASAVRPTSRREAVLLGDVVVPVVKPHRDGSPRPSFHPKFVLVRYAGAGTSRLRLICMSRNLTADTSRDVAVILDGEVAGTPESSNEPLATALEILPAWAIQPHHREGSLSLVQDLADTVRRARWAVPNGFHSINVLPLGMGTEGHPITPLHAEHRVLVLSPFVRKTRLRELVSNREATIISNLGTLDELPVELLAPHDVRHPDKANADLHAKLYVFEGAGSKRWVIGSANATPAAIGRNAEMVIELTGGKRAPGIDDLLHDEHGIGGTLTRYLRDPAADAEEQAPTAAEIAMQRLAACRFTAHVRPARSGHYRLEVSVDHLPALGGATVTGSIAERHPTVLVFARQPVAAFDNVRRDQIVPFLCLVVEANGIQATCLVALALDGIDTSDLADDLLTDTLEQPNSGGPLEYVRQVLLGVIPPVPELRFEDVDEAPSEPDGGYAVAGASSTPAHALLEPMLSALEDPSGRERLEELERVVSSLRDKLEDFPAMWDAFAEAQRRR